MHGAGWIRRIPALPKLSALVAVAVIVVATPRDAYAAFALYAAAVLGILIAARLPVLLVARRLVIEAPFVVFALLLPFVAAGPRIDVGGMSLSVEGLQGAFGLLAKATLVLLFAIAVSSTTPPGRIVQALERLRLPRELTSIMAFMLRYLDIVGDEARRMRTARASRGFAARGPRSWRVLAAGVGALFVRAHGRGERVHLAMLARGYGA